MAPAALFAQQPGRVIAPPPSLPANPAAPARGVAPARNDAELFKVQFPNAQVTDVLSYYEMLTGKHVLADQNVQGQVNIVINESVTRAEAIQIIETQLTLNGYPLIPASDNIIKVLGVGKQVRSAGVPLYYSDLSMLPAGEQTVSYLLKLHYLDASETATQLGQYILPSSYNGFTPLPKSGAIIITETASTVRKLVTLITQLDVPAAPVVEKFIKLERADASKTVEFLNSVFDTKSGGAGASTPGAPPPGVPTPGGPRRTIRRINEDGQPAEPVLLPNAVPGQGLIALSGDSIIQGRITLTPDLRTNRIHVVTAPVNMPLVEKLVADYDANTPFASPIRRDLRFVNARDVLPILVQAISDPGSDANANGSASPNTPNRPPQTNNNNASNNLFGNSNNASGGFGGSGSGSGFGGEELNTQPVDTTPTEATVGTTKIIADPRSNTIILLGSAEAKDKVFKVLDQLDVRAPQVVIRVVIGELSIGNNSEFGLNYLLNKKRGLLAGQYSSGFFTPTNTGTGTGTGTDGTGTGTTGTTTGTTTAASTLNTITALASGLPSGFTGLAGIVSVTKSFDIILSALEATNRFKTVNRPVIFTSNNKKATIISGQEIAVPTNALSTTNTSSLGSVGLQTNVEFKTVALQLEVVPLINSAREVTLDIVQKLDSVVAGSSVSVGGNNIPTIAKREIKSSISMPNGATAVLGGLITQSDQKTSGNIPILSKIPVFGDLLFKTKSHNVSRSELIILLHPEVTNSPTELVDQRAEEDRHMYLQDNLEEQLTPLERRALPVTPTATTTTTRTTTVRTKAPVYVK